ncbi:MAG TPA: hypothetical protein VGX76_08400, partial [Pirellulales bacterium]|nr:hypothetical protein [Pirellulales bacterium]
MRAILDFRFSILDARVIQGKLRVLLALSLAAGAAWNSSLVAAERAITVFGTGEVLVKPTHVEIDLNANAAAELTGDAIQKYRDSLRRTTEAFKKLEMKD